MNAAVGPYRQMPATLERAWRLLGRMRLWAASHPAIPACVLLAGISTTVAITLAVGPDLVTGLTLGGASWLAFAACFLSLMPVPAARRWLLVLRGLAVGGVRFRQVVKAMLMLRFVGLFTSALASDLVGRFALIAPTVQQRRRVAISLGIDRGLDVVYAIALAPIAALAIMGYFPGHSFSLLAAAVVTPPLLGMLAVSAGPFRSRPTRRDVLDAWVCTAVRNLCLAAAAYGVMRALAIHAPFATVAALTALSQLTAGLSVTPGAWGILEAGWIGLLTSVGVPVQEAAQFAVMMRGLQTLTFGVGAAAAMAPRLITRPSRLGPPPLLSDAPQG